MKNNLNKIKNKTDYKSRNKKLQSTLLLALTRRIKATTATTTNTTTKYQHQ